MWNLRGASLLAMLAACGDKASEEATCQPIPEPRIVEVPGPTRVIFAGDAMIGRNVDDVLTQRTMLNPWSDLDELVSRGGAMVVNLESTITDSQEPWPDKKWNFKASPANTPRALGTGLPTVASVANNHGMDFGLTGLVDTLDALEANGITPLGGGLDLDDARRAVVLDFVDTDRRIAILGATDHCSCNDEAGWYADPDGSGVRRAETPRPGKLNCDVAALADDPDIDAVVAMVHWGPNILPDLAPEPDEQAGARAVIDAGARLLVSTSAHHVMPVEEYGGGWIAYGPGDVIHDFIFPDPTPIHHDLASLAVFDLDEDALQMRPIRVARAGGKVQLIPAKHPDYTEVMDALQR